MASPTGGVTVRPAQYGDHEAVLAINRTIFGGLDYLRFTFHTRLSEQNSFPVVALIEDHVVGYLCGHVIDAGESIVMESGRILEDHRGKAISAKVHNSVLVSAKRAYPNLTRMLWISDKTSTAVDSYNSHSFFKLMDVRPRVSFDSSINSLRTLCHSQTFLNLQKSKQVDQISAIPQRQAMNLLTLEAKLLPYTPEVLFIKSQPWGWHPSTLTELLNVSNLHVSRSKTTGELLAFSFGSVDNVERGIRYRADFFCHPDSPGLAVSHLLYHIREFACTQNEANVSFSCFFSQQVDKAGLKTLLSEQLNLLPKNTLEVDGLLFGCNLSDLAQPKSNI